MDPVVNQRPIGVFDSGIGGLTVVAALAEEMPEERIFYFGDTARCPYGDRTPEEVLRYTRACLDFLYCQGVKLLVLACNSATAAALPHLQGRYDIPVVGVIQPGVRAAVVASGKRTIGVIGTTVTISSGAYQREIERRLPGAKVCALACPAFVPLVERGEWDGPVTERIVRTSLAPLLDEGIDALILGCTHYPLLTPVIERVVGPGVTLISSAAETAREVRAILESLGQCAIAEEKAPPEHVFFTTGQPVRMEAALDKWLHLPHSRAVVRAVDPAQVAGDLAEPEVRLQGVRLRPSLGHSFP